MESVQIGDNPLTHLSDAARLSLPATPLQSTPDRTFGSANQIQKQLNSSPSSIAPLYHTKNTLHGAISCFSDTACADEQIHEMVADKATGGASYLYATISKKSLEAPTENISCMIETCSVGPSI